MKRIPSQFLFKSRKILKVYCALAFLFSVICLQAQVANYQLDRLGDNLFQVSLIPNVTYTNPNNLVNSAQVVVKVKTGGFAVSNLTNLINTGLSNEVSFTNSSRNNAPALNPGYDYISFSLQSGATTDIPFTTGVPVPLFTFQNGGICTQDSLYLIRTDDPFHFSNNSGVANTQHQLTVLGFGGPDAPVDLSLIHI